METPGGSATSEAPVTRRTLLDVLLGSSALAWLAAVVYPVLRYLTPPKDAGGANKVTLTPEQKGELTAKGFLVVRLGTDRVLVFRGQDQKVRALSARCTHEGCTVQYVPTEALIWCACHNGKFNPDGRVISGPPPRPLVAFAVTTEGDAITVSRGGGAA